MYHVGIRSRPPTMHDDHSIADVGSAAMLCRLTAEVRHTAPSVEAMHPSFVRSRICSASHIFLVSRFRPLFNSQVMSRRQATSRNQSCRTRVEIGDSWSNEMYMERAAHPVFSIKSLIRSDTRFNLPNDEIFAWPLTAAYIKKSTVSSHFFVHYLSIVWAAIHVLDLLELNTALIESSKLGTLQTRSLSSNPERSNPGMWSPSLSFHHLHEQRHQSTTNYSSELAEHAVSEGTKARPGSIIKTFHLICHPSFYLQAMPFAQSSPQPVRSRVVYSECHQRE